MAQTTASCSDKNAKVLIVASEGLFSYDIGYVRNELILPVVKKYPAGQVVWADFAWTDEAGAQACAAQWSKYLIEIGHSYGGKMIQDLVNAQGPRVVDYVITADPRLPWYLGSFQRPANAKAWHNYYELYQWFLTGYTIPGADLNEDLGSILHVNMPGQPAVFMDLTNAINAALAVQ